MNSGKRVKKSYSISPEAEQFIRKVRKSRKIRSDSQALEHILRDALEAQSLASMNAAAAAYYDAASSEQLSEEATWAAHGAREIVALPL